jgi:SnoaL-like domain
MQSEDIATVVNVINLYPVAVDTQQWDLFDLAFTADAGADFGGRPSGMTERRSSRCSK